MQTFGEQLTAARKARGMTQEDLATAVNVSRTTVSSWERNRTQPDLDLLRKLSAVLDFRFSIVAEDDAPPVDAVAEPTDASEATAPTDEAPAQVSAPTASAPRRRWRWRFALAALVICVGVAVVLLLRPAPSKFPEKTFRQATENVPGQAFVVFENTKQEQTMGENVYSLYDFKLCERNGVGFASSARRSPWKARAARCAS